MSPQHHSFVHLHVHSGYSLLDGACHPDALAARAKEHGQPAIALTDHGVLHGVVGFYEACVAAGVKPIIGMEAYVAPGDRRNHNKTGARDRGSHLLLLATDLTGYHNLLKLATIGYTEGFYHNPRIDHEVLGAHSQGLVATSACLAGEIATALRHDDRETAQQVAETYASIFDPGRFFIELQSHIQEQAEVNTKLIGLADRVGLGIVATNDVHFLNPEDHAAHDVLTCVGRNEKLSDESRFVYPRQLYLKNTEEMYAAAPDLGHRWLEACTNTQQIAEMCSLELNLKASHAPAVRVERQSNGEVAGHAKHRDGRSLDVVADQFSVMPLTEAPTEEEAQHCDAALRDLVEAGARPRYGDQLSETVRQRIDHELAVLSDKQISAYFLMVWDAVRFARSQGISCTARGSGVGSMVAHCLGLSAACPIRFGLLFERFTDPDRSEYPDLDIDICQDGRADVIEYLRRKYKHVAQIMAFDSLQTKAVLKSVSRVLGVSRTKADAVASLIPDLPGTSIDTTLSASSDLQKLAKNDPEVARVLDLSRPLQGLPRHVSTHPAGIVVANRPLDEVVPLYRKGGKGDLLTQWDGPTVEKAGLLKMDFIGSRTLSVIEKTLQLVSETLHTQVDLQSVPEDDAAAWDLFRRADTDGIFQFESEGMRDLLLGMRPQSLEDLIAAVALYRPGPIGLIPSFLARKNGEEAVPEIHPTVDKHTRETYGVMVYQEQVMLIMNELGGIPLRQAYTIIRAISKKKQQVIAAARNDFLSGAASNGMCPDKAANLFDQILDFASYGFNKSHAAGYSIIAYQMAWLKAYYPVQFMAARLAYDAGDSKATDKRIEQCRHVRLPNGGMGITVLPPDINQSAAGFSVDYADGTLRDGSHGRLRFGLGAVKGLGTSAVDTILAARQEGGPFQSLQDFRSRIAARKVNKNALKSLIQGGAFDALHGTGQRGYLLAYAEESNKADHTAFPETPLIDVLEGELRSLGMYVSGHPLDANQEVLEPYVTHSIEESLEETAGKKVITAGIVNRVHTHRIKRGQYSGQQMAFVTFAGRVSKIEGVLFAGPYTRAKDVLLQESVVVVKGEVQHRDGKVNLITDQVIPVHDVSSVMTRKASIVLEATEGSDLDLILHQVRSLINAHPGNVPVELDIRLPGTVVMGALHGTGIDTNRDLITQLKQVLGKRGELLLRGPGSSAA